MSGASLMMSADEDMYRRPPCNTPNYSELKNSTKSGLNPTVIISFNGLKMQCTAVAVCSIAILIETIHKTAFCFTEKSKN